MKVFRYDNYLDNIKGVEVDEETTPTDCWLIPMMGDGEYIYTATYVQALKYREGHILECLEESKEKLLDVRNKIEENT